MKNLYIYFATISVVFCLGCGKNKTKKSSENINLNTTNVAKEPSSELIENEKTIISESVKHSLPPIPEELEFAGERVPLENDLVRDRLINQLIIQSNRHSRTLIMLRLKSKWEGMIREILKKKGVPEDFFYLAIAESELNNEIKSPRNALGMWQFLKKTGLEYGLIIDNHIDQRRDPEKATEVACDYLIEAKRKLGSWTNATASYNVGMAGLKSSMESQKETDYYKLFLNSETSKYVFRILAMKLVYSNPEAYGYHIDDKDKINVKLKLPLEVKDLSLESLLKK